MFNALGVVGELLGWAGEAAEAAVGWAWETVVRGIYSWLASGIVWLVEWVWRVLDSGSTPQVTAGWFRNELAAEVGAVALAMTIALMFASAAQAAVAGRPEQIGDALKEGALAIVGSAFTITVVDLMIQLVDEVSELVWEIGRGDMVLMVEGMLMLLTVGGPVATSFIGPFVLLVGFAGLVGLTVALSMRSALIYLVAAMAPLVWASSVLPVMRGSTRRMVHLLVALIVSKLAIVISLVVAVKLIANPAGDPTSDNVIDDAAAVVGTLLAGFTCFVVAAVAPWVLYKLMPTVEGAVVSSGVVGGFGRSAMSATHTGLMIKGMTKSPASRKAPGQESAGGGGGGSGRGGGARGSGPVGGGRGGGAAGGAGGAAGAALGAGQAAGAAAKQGASKVAEKAEGTTEAAAGAEGGAQSDADAGGRASTGGGSSPSSSSGSQYGEGWDVWTKAENTEPQAYPSGRPVPNLPEEPMPAPGTPEEGKFARPRRKDRG